MVRLSATEAQLPAFMAESIFYGVYIITFFISLQRLLWDDRGNWKSLRRINILMIAVVLLLFVSSSMNLALALLRNMRFFVYSLERGGRKPNRVGEVWLNVLKSTTVILQTVIADSILVYRCWLVWNKSLLVIVGPFFCWLGSIACGVCLLYFQWLLESRSGAYANNMFVVSAAFWCCTILVNLCSTTLILRQIWKIQRAWKPPSICSIQDIPQRNRLRFAQRIIVESGLLYTAVTVIVFIDHLCQDGSIYITTAIEIQVTGIAFNLILMRSAGPYPDRMDTIPLSRGVDGVSSGEGLEAHSTVDAGVMTVGARGSNCTTPQFTS